MKYRSAISKIHGAFRAWTVPATSPCCSPRCAAPELLRQSSESLAGRIHYHELAGFRLDETGVSKAQRLWLRGGFPRSLLARSDGMSDVSVRRYLDLLCSLFLVRQLAPWYQNLGKRLVKSPKVYVADSGLLHRLLGIETRDALVRHPKLGASWEGFALSAVQARLGAARGECFFYATHGGAELDLLVARGARRLGFEFKRTVAPEITKSMRVALADLRLQRLDVIHAGERTYPLAPRVRAVALERVLRAIAPL